MRCPACGAESWAPFVTVRGHRYVRCRTCGTGRLEPLPSQAEAAVLYDASYFLDATTGGYHDYDGDEELHRRNARRRLAAVGRRGITGGSVIDVGCATGYFLDEARRAGFASVAGVDVSSHARAEAARRFGLPVFEEIAAVSAPADAVTFFQSLEHMADPLEALAAGRQALRTGGVLAIETWDVGSAVARAMGRWWQQLTPPSVVWLFSAAGLRDLLQRSGFHAVEIRRTSKEVSVGLAIAQAGAKLGVASAAERLARSAVGRLPVRYGLGDLVIATALG